MSHLDHQSAIRRAVATIHSQRYYKDRIATANGMRWVVVDADRIETNMFDPRVLVADCTSEEAAQAAFVLMAGAA